MADRAVRTLRKRPRQQRSRDTVERIIDAAAHVLSERGYDGASTNAIARRAGLSPGSLYQYFVDKDAVVSAVLQRFVQQLLDVVSDPDSTVGRPADPEFAANVLGLLRILESQETLLRVLLNEVPRLGPDDAREMLNGRVYDRFRMALAMSDDATDVDARCWTAATIARTLPVRYVLDKPGFPPEQLVSTMTTALVALVGSSG